MSGAASADSSYTFSINDAGSKTFNDGQVRWVGVDVGGDVVWDGFDVPVEALRFISEITIADGGDTGWHTLKDTTSDPLGQWSGDGDSNGWGGDGEYVAYKNDGGREGRVVTDAKWLIISDGTEPSDYRTVNYIDWTDRLSVDSDGSTETFTVKKRSTIYFTDANGNHLSLPSDVQPTQATAEFDLTVSNESAATGGGSSGSGDFGD